LLSQFRLLQIEFENAELHKLRSGRGRWHPKNCAAEYITAR